MTKYRFLFGQLRLLEQGSPMLRTLLWEVSLGTEWEGIFSNERSTTPNLDLAPTLQVPTI